MKRIFFNAGFFLTGMLLPGFILLTLTAAGQTNQDTAQVQNYTAREVILLLEQKHDISIFYRPEWFEGQSYPVDVAARPLPEALQELIKGLNMRIHVLDGMFFLMLSDQPERYLAASYGDEVTIGNPNEFGRYSRATISGTITDGETGEPLVGAVLFDPETGTGASTDINGRFNMLLPAGHSQLRVTYIGYEDRIQRVRLISDGQLNMEMFTASTQLEEVTVVARRLEENITRTQMSLVKLDAKAIKELPGSYGEPDIIRSISLMPGVQTIGEFGTGFNVRGGSADQNLILMEHVPVFNTSHLFGLVSVVNPDLVNSVTLIKAGTPARFGERAASVMDIRLGEGLNTQRIAVKGSVGILNSRVMLESPVVQHKATIAVAARTSNADLYLKKMPTEDLMNSAAGFWDISAISTIALNGKNTISLFGYHSFDRFSFGGETSYAYSNTLSSLRWNSAFGPRLVSALVIGTSDYTLETRDEPELYPDTHFRMDNGIEYRSLKWDIGYDPHPDHHLAFGINAISYGIKPGRLEPLGEYSAMQHQQIDKEQGVELAAYVSGDINLSDNISIEAGLRFSQYLQLGPGKNYLYGEGLPITENNLTDSVFYTDSEIMSRYEGLEPRFGLRWRTGEYSSLKISFARIHQYINLISNTSVAGPSDVWKLSDMHLKPLRSDQYAVGYFQNFLENSVEMSLELYYKQLHNAIDYLSGAEISMNPALEASVLNVKGNNYGLEFYLRRAVGRLNGWTSYTWSASMRRTTKPFPETQINRNNYFPSNFDRPHNLVMNMNYQISRRWRFGATFTYNTGRPVTLPELIYTHGQDRILYFSDRNKYRLPDYHRLDVSISLDENLRLSSRGKGSFTFSVMNVYGRKNPHTVFYRREPDSYYTSANYKLYQMFIIARPLPTLSYTFSF